MIAAILILNVLLLAATYGLWKLENQLREYKIRMDYAEKELRWYRNKEGEDLLKKYSEEK